MNRLYHIVHLPRAYPSKLSPVSSIFFKEQVSAISQYDKTIKLGVIAIIQKPLFSNHFFNNCRLLFSSDKLHRENIITWLKYLFTVPLPYRIKRKYINFRLILLFEKYISIYGKPDLIHLQTYEMGAVAIKILEKYDIPYIVTEHSSNLYNDATRNTHDFLHKIYLKSSFNIAVSPFFANYLTNKFAVPFTPIPNIVDTNKFTLKPEHTTPKVNLLHVAHCVKIKQQKLLLMGFAKALEKNPYLKLTIVGDGPELVSLKSLVIELEINNSVTFTGSLNNDDVKAQMHRADIFILTSKKETFGVVLIEALAVGLPCISTKSGGPEGIITSEELGMLCDQNSDDIASAILLVAKNQYNSYKIRKYVTETFSPLIVGASIKKIYEEVLTRGSN